MSAAIQFATWIMCQSTALGVFDLAHMNFLVKLAFTKKKRGGGRQRVFVKDKFTVEMAFFCDMTKSVCQSHLP